MSFTLNETKAMKEDEEEKAVFLLCRAQHSKTGNNSRNFIFTSMTFTHSKQNRRFKYP